MKKSLFFLTVLVCAIVFFAGCTSTSVRYQTIAVTENPVGTKVGQINQMQGGVLAAARNAGITRISTVSKQLTETYFHNWYTGQTTVTSQKFEIIVTGE
jgi:hypothetical protein